MLYFIETVVDGTGRIIDFGFVSLQMILLSLAFIVSLYPFIKGFKAAIMNPCVIAALLFGTDLGFDMNIIDGDKSEYMYLDFIMKL